MVEQMDLFLASAMEEKPKQPKITEEDLQKKHDKIYEETKLTPREWAVYRLIKYNSEVLGRRTTQREIYEKVEGFKWNDSATCHDHCPAIWTDICHNNLSFEHEKIIISFNFEYWIGNEKETKVFLDKLWGEIEPRLVRYWTYKKKAKRNGQGRLLDKNGNIIDENSVRQFVESFIGEDYEWRFISN